MKQYFVTLLFLWWGQILFSQNISDSLFFQAKFGWKIKYVEIFDISNNTSIILDNYNGHLYKCKGFSINEKTDTIKIEINYRFKRTAQTTFFKVAEIPNCNLEQNCKFKYVWIWKQNKKIQLQFYRRPYRKI